MCLAIPGQILDAPGESETTALVEVSGVRRVIDLALIDPEARQPGQWVLIHVGFALSALSEQRAAEQLMLLRMLGEEAAALEEAEGYAGCEESPPERENGP